MKNTKVNREYLILEIERAKGVLTQTQKALENDQIQKARESMAVAKIILFPISRDLQRMLKYKACLTCEV